MKYFINKNGEFWFENDEKNKFCGKIIEGTNSFYLETDLDKSFNIPKEYLTIVGKIGNTRITLYKCSLNNNSLKKTFLVRYIFENYNNETELNFNNIIVQYHNLENWIEKDSFDVTYENNAPTISPTKKEISYTYGMGNIKFILDYSTSKKFNSFTIEKKYYIKLEYEMLQDFDQILKNIKTLKHFLTLAMYNQTNFKNISCYINSSNKRNKINIYSKLFDYTPTEFTRFYSLLYFSDIESKGDIFERWFDIYDKYKPLFDIYFTNFSENITIEYQFLSYTQALEAYMRKNETFKDNFMDPEEYENIKSELNVYVKNSEMDDDHKQSWESRITYGNEVSLRKRLKDLIRYLKEFDITQKITNGDMQGFNDNVVYFRNYYTHYGHDDNPNINEVIGLTFDLKLLIELCILNELNLDKEFIDYTLNRVYERKPVIL